MYPQKRFYHSVIESVLPFSICVWFVCASNEEKGQRETLEFEFISTTTAT